MSVLFISGIDTDIGKTYATGLLARALQAQGVSVITQKLVQTGISTAANGELGIADDILTHRRLMGIDLQPCDVDHSTCPHRYEKPASPHLAAELSDRPPLDIDIITAATQRLQQDYKVVLLEGAGGLLVPITTQLLSLDYIAAQGYPVVLVTSGRLGSINHTLLSLEAITQRGLRVHSVIYNHIHDDDEQIAASTRAFLQQHLEQHYPQTHWLTLPQQPEVSSSSGNASSEDTVLHLPSAFI